MSSSPEQLEPLPTIQASLLPISRSSQSKCLAVLQRYLKIYSNDANDSGGGVVEAQSTSRMNRGIRVPAWLTPNQSSSDAPPADDLVEPPSRAKNALTRLGWRTILSPSRLFPFPSSPNLF
jgi:hypothetical protein